MAVNWTRRALAQVDAIGRHIERDNPAIARQVVSRIFEAVDRLSAHPESGRPGRVVGTRELVVPGLPFIIAYRVNGSVIDLVAVLHARQRWPRAF